jgi:hypothetical protein
MTPRLVSVHFGTAAGDQWPRLARVLAWSARRHCPDWEVDVRAFEPAPCRAPSASASCVANTQKLDEWARVVTAAADGDHLALLDADTMIVNPLDAVWDGAFDLAYTVRPPASPYPINAGVVFVRVGPGTRAFVTRWRDENRRMLRDRDHHAKWRKRYGGINQAALGCLLEQGGHNLALAPLPCQAWNCEDASWEAFDVATTRIVHIKSGFRRALFLRTHAPGCLGPLVKLWRGYEHAALAAVAAPGIGAADPFGRRPRGRPRGPETVNACVRLPQPLHDALCRRALAVGRPNYVVIQQILAAALNQGTGISALSKSTKRDGPTILPHGHA